MGSGLPRSTHELQPRGARGQVVAQSELEARIPAVLRLFRLPDSLLAADAAVDGGEPAAEVRGDLTHAVAVFALGIGDRVCVR